MRRGALALALTTSVVAMGWMAPAVEAQTPPVTTTTPTTAPPGAAATTTTTTNGRVTTTTAARKSTSTSTSTTAAPLNPAATFPPGLLAIANSVKRSPPSNDAALMAALAPLQQLGYTAQQAMLAGMGHFPVAGPAYYTDDWMEPRPGNPPRLHYGDDIVAAAGTPIRAPIDGVLKYDTSDPAGYGLAAIVTGADGTFYLNGHLSATIKGLATGSAVQQGQEIGLVGETGDATGPHDHFEVHPLGGAGVDPKAVLDAWQAEAIKAVPALIRSIKGEPSPTQSTVVPLQIELPVPQAAFSQPQPLPLPLLTKPSASERSLAGLALVGLLALLASSSLAANRFRPPWLLRLAIRRGRGEPRVVPPRPAH